MFLRRREVYKTHSIVVYLNISKTKKECLSAHSSVWFVLFFLASPTNKHIVCQDISELRFQCQNALWTTKNGLIAVYDVNKKTVHTVDASHMRVLGYSQVRLSLDVPHVEAVSEFFSTYESVLMFVQNLWGSTLKNANIYNEQRHTSAARKQKVSHAGKTANWTYSQTVLWLYRCFVSMDVDLL